MLAGRVGVGVGVGGTANEGLVFASSQAWGLIPHGSECSLSAGRGNWHNCVVITGKLLINNCVSEAGRRQMAQADAVRLGVRWGGLGAGLSLEMGTEPWGEGGGWCLAGTRPGSGFPAVFLLKCSPCLVAKAAE